MLKQPVLILAENDFPKNLRDGKDFYWLFLGRDYERLLKLKVSAPAGSLYIDLGDLLNDISYKLRRPYIDYIASLSTKFNSLPWWISDVAEKNVMGSPAFLYICYLKIMKELLSAKFKNKNVCIVSESAVLLEIIKRSDFTTDYRIVRKYDYQLYVAKDILRILYRTSRFVLKSIYRKIYAFITRQNKKKSIEHTNGELTIIRTWVGEKNFSSEGEFRDLYFPNLYNYLLEKGVSAAILPIINTNSKLTYVNAMCRIRKSDQVFIIPEDYYRPNDYLQTIILAFRSVVLMFRKFVFAGMDISLLFKNENMRYMLLWESGQVIMHYFLIKRLRDQGIKIKQIIYTFENMLPEKSLILGKARFSPDTKLYGFQHASLFPLSLCLYTSKDEIDILPMPDKIICSGNFFKQTLIDEGFPLAKMVVGPALRFQYLLKLDSNRQNRSQNDIVLITLPLARSSALELLSKAWNVLHAQKRLRIWLKPHPMMSSLELDAIINKVEMSKDSYDIVDETMADVLPKVSMLIAMASATIFDAIAYGIPVIRVRSDLDLNFDPMDWFPKDDMHFVARTLNELDEEIDKILNLSDVKYSHLKDKGGQIIQACFSPVNEQTMATFL